MKDYFSTITRTPDLDDLYDEAFDRYIAEGASPEQAEYSAQIEVENFCQDWENQDA